MIRITHIPPLFPLLLAALLRCSAYPYFWYDPDLRPPEYGFAFQREPTCVEHPTEPGAHGVPQADSTIAFAFYDATGVTSGALCPGGQYTLRLSFDDPRLALLTADPANSTTFSNPAPTPDCPNRVAFYPINQTAFNATFKLPCGSAGSSVLFKATSVGLYSGWLYNSVTVTVSPAEAASCAAQSALCLPRRPPPVIRQPPEAPPSPSPSPPLPTAPPPPRPLYPPSPSSPSPAPPFPSPASPSPPSPSPPSPSPPPIPLLSTCTPSFLGYKCMITQGKVTVHWSLNTASAPPNECTPTNKAELQTADLAANGVLHMAVQSELPGYVALGFGTATGKMAPADIVLGWPGDGGSTVSYLNTFYITRSSVRESDVSPPAGTPSWAYDKSVVRSVTSGLTTLCFSRRLTDDTAKAVGDLTGVRFPPVKASGSRRRLLQEGPAGAVPVRLLWAVSNQTALVKHVTDSRGAFWLNLAATTPSPSTLPVVSQPSAAIIDSTQTPTQTPTSSPPVSPAAGNCTPSTLGYKCMIEKGKVTVHWSLNTASAPPNECTPTTKTVLQSGELATNGSLHVAVQASVGGYVALGFSNTPDVMAPADIALGWAGGTSSDTSFNTFHAVDDDLDETDISPPLGTPSWAYDRGVVRNATSGITTLCFSRRLKDSRADTSSDLQAVLGAAAGQDSHLSSRRRATEDSDGGIVDGEEGSMAGGAGMLGFTWAVSDAQGLVQHMAGNVGGFWLDPSSGNAVEVESSERFWINVHGVLMAVAWGLLLPLGTLFPAHRWLFNGKQVFGQQLWFVLHTTTQWTGMFLFIAGFIIANVKLDGDGSGMRDAHENIGIAIMAAAGAQVVLAFIRPPPPSPGETLSTRRRVWNFFHHNLGRSVVQLAWANVYIGIYVYHTSIWAASYTPWITPIAIVMGVLVLVDVVLRIASLGASSKYDVSKQADDAANISSGSAPTSLTSLPDTELKAQAN